MPGASAGLSAPPLHARPIAALPPSHTRARGRTALAAASGLLLIVGTVLGGARPARAQQATEPSAQVPSGTQRAAPVDEAPATGPRRVAGRVVVAGGAAPRPLPDAWVTLHRVGPDAQSPLDSIRTSARGAYAFDFQATGSETAVYFVSSLYGGIAYFSPPLRARVTSGDAAEITVFDTTSTNVPITVRGRHLIVLAPSAAGEREVLEVFELSNDGGRTRIASGGADSSTWSSVLPAGATRFRVGQGDVGADALAERAGRVELYAPLAPGLKQITYAYTIASRGFPMSVPLQRGTTVLEVLIEERAASVEGAGLVEVNPVVQDGRAFRRFLAEDAPAAAVVRITVPVTTGQGERSLYVVAVVTLAGVLMLLALLRASGRLGRGRAVRVGGAGRGAAAENPERLAKQIHDLDASFARKRTPAPDADAAYQARRTELKDRLTAALAARHDRR